MTRFVRHASCRGRPQAALLEDERHDAIDSLVLVELQAARSGLGLLDEPRRGRMCKVRVCSSWRRTAVPPPIIVMKPK
jgi:hypothetical protein